MGMNRQDIKLFINGATYVVGTEPKIGRADIFINNQYFMTHWYKKRTMGGPHEDIAIVLDGVMCIVTIRWNGLWTPIRIAIDGRYLDNGKPYIPAAARPDWFVVFYLLHFIGVFISGFFHRIYYIDLG